MNLYRILTNGLEVFIYFASLLCQTRLTGRKGFTGFKPLCPLSIAGCCHRCVFSREGHIYCQVSTYIRHSMYRAFVERVWRFYWAVNADGKLEETPVSL